MKNTRTQKMSQEQPNPTTEVETDEDTDADDESDTREAVRSAEQLMDELKTEGPNGKPDKTGRGKPDHAGNGEAPLVAEDPTIEDEGAKSAMYVNERKEALRNIVKIREDLAVRSSDLKDELRAFVDRLEGMEQALQSIDPDKLDEPLAEVHETTLNSVQQNKQMFERFTR